MISGRLIGTNQTGGAADLRASYSYDSDSRLKSINYSIPSVVDSATETFYYNTNTTDSISDGALTSMALFSNEWIYYRYDSLSRLKERDVGGILTEHQTYLAGSGTCTTTTLPETFYTTSKGSSTKLSGFKYTYNAVGNITRITNLLDNTYMAYAYDKLGQMQYATDYAANGTAQARYYYYYDNGGNLTRWQERDSTGQTVLKEHVYTYGDANWKDLLTAYDGQSITYDGSGNPLSYYNGQRYTMTWRNGRELNTATVGGKTYSYEYDVNGLRTRKTNSDGGYTQYYIVDGLTVAEQRFTSTGAEKYTLPYLYDESNSPVGFDIQYPGGTTWTNYYFAKNLQGDVIALYLWNGTSTGTLVATYKYDPWGKPIGIFDASGATISQTAANVAAYNPFRYRGYRYDADTGFYYLQSRYYDPAICRFINADAFASTGQGFLGHNMFVYCSNNSVNMIDPTGTMPKFLPEFLKEFSEWVETALGTLLYVPIVDKKGYLLEYWVDSNGKVRWSRHHTNHGNSKRHPVVPHDHEWYDDDDGNNTEDSNWQPPNSGFQAPNSGNDNSTKMVTGTVGTVAIGYVIYVGAKWIIAALTAPATGGGSLIVAGATP